MAVPSAVAQETVIALSDTLLSDTVNTKAVAPVLPSGMEASVIKMVGLLAGGGGVVPPPLSLLEQELKNVVAAKNKLRYIIVVFFI